MKLQDKFVLDRVQKVLDEAKRLVWDGDEALEVAIYQCAEPIAWAEAIKKDYEPIKEGHPWGPTWSTAWFRMRGKIPAPWKGSKVAMLVDTDSEALVWEEGTPAQGLDINRFDYLLRKEALDAGSFEIFVEAAGNHLFGERARQDRLDRNSPEGNGDAPFRFRRARLSRRNDEAWGLYNDLLLLLDLAKQLPATHPRRSKILYALNQACNEFQAGSEGSGAKAARGILAGPLASKADASATQAWACGHSHIDTAWLWPIRETIRKCSRTFSTVLKYMEEYPDYHFTCSTPQQYDYVKQHYPKLYEKIKKAVAGGRWEAEGGMWVEADCNVPSGEALVRQFLYGMRFFEKEFGARNSILWLPDVFGYSAALPQIMKLCGLPYFLTQKISWNDTNRFPHHTFWWEGIDGSKVLSHFLPANTYNGVMTPGELMAGEKNFEEKDRSGSWMQVYGHGDGGGGVTREMLESCVRMKDLEGLPKVKQGKAADWFKQLEKNAKDLSSWRGELYLEMHRGTYTTQAKNKYENRKCEFLLRDAEFLAAVAPSGLKGYPQESLEKAWKLVLLNQFHDILPGSSIKWVYEDSQKDYAEVHKIADAAIATAQADFAAAFNTKDLKRPFAVWNTLSFERSELLELEGSFASGLSLKDEKGSAFRTQALGASKLLVEAKGVPSMGYKIFDLAEGPAAAGGDEAKAGKDYLENSLLKANFDAQGRLLSLYDKAAQRELIPEGKAGNDLQVFRDLPNQWDAWDINPFYEDMEWKGEAKASLELAEQGPLRAALCLKRKIGEASSLTQWIRLEAGSPRLDFVTEVDWHESHRLLKVEFPLEVHNSTATCEIQYGHLERQANRNSSWEQAKFEIPAQKWVELAEGGYGVALLNDCKYGLDMGAGRIRLSLLRSSKYPDPDADQGKHHFTYSLLPHRGGLEEGRVPQQAYALNVPLRVQELKAGNAGSLPREKSYFSVDVPQLLIESVKRSEDGQGLVVRLYEAFRSRGKAKVQAQGWKQGTGVNLLEEPLEGQASLKDGVFDLDFKPFQILSFLLKQG